MPLSGKKSREISQFHDSFFVQLYTQLLQRRHTQAVAQHRDGRLQLCHRGQRGGDTDIGIVGVDTVGIGGIPPKLPNEGMGAGGGLGVDRCACGAACRRTGALGCAEAGAVAGRCTGALA